MKKTIYLFKDCTIQRKENTIRLIFSNKEMKVLPVESISEFMIFGEITINKRLMEFLTKSKISLHLFNHYGYYIGSYYPREYLNSGIIILKQAEYYLDHIKRLFLSKQFIKGAIANILLNLKYYQSHHNIQLSNEIKTIKDFYNKIDIINTINELMAIEGNAREIYYHSFNKILSDNFFYSEKREKRPPDNPLNALISFGNSLMYVTVLSLIYQTHLDPRIGFLHYTNQRSFSLNLDIAEIFKPIIVDRVIFSLINKKQINEKHFDKKLNYSYLNEKGKKIFIQEYENKLQTKIKPKKLKKKKSYRSIIKMECYKLYKHLLEEENYKPFKGEW